MLEDRLQRELERAARAYAERDADSASAARYDPMRPVNLFRLQQRDWVVARLLRDNGVPTLSGVDILEVGCGSGGSLERLIGLGADEVRLAGLDLSESRIEGARRRMPNADLRVGSAHALPFADASFDMVAQFTLFSSVIDSEVRLAIAREMQRVLRPAGHVLWYEAHRARPTPDFVPIPDSELRALFPGWRMSRVPATLRWWFIERVAPRSRLAAQVMEQIPYLCSHTIAVLQRDEASVNGKTPRLRLHRASRTCRWHVAPCRGASVAAPGHGSDKPAARRARDGAREVKLAARAARTAKIDLAWRSKQKGAGGQSGTRQPLDSPENPST